MGGILEGMIAVMGLLAGGMVTITSLLVEDATIPMEVNESYVNPRTILPGEERVAA